MSSTVTCPRCGTANQAAARFCKSCGGPMAAAAPAAPAPTMAMPAASPPPNATVPPYHGVAPPTMAMPAASPPPDATVPLAAPAPPPTAPRSSGPLLLIIGLAIALGLLVVCAAGGFLILRMGPGGFAAFAPAAPPTASPTEEQATEPTEDVEATEAVATRRAGERATERAGTAAAVSDATSAAADALDLAATDEALAQRATATAEAQSFMATALAELQALPTVTPEPPTPTPEPPTATPEPPTAVPAPTAPPQRLRFVKLNENDDPSCISVQIKGVAAANWSFLIDGTRIAGRFDASGNARACGLAPRQEVTFTVYNARGAAMPGGRGVPARGSAIMQATWR